MHELPLTKNIIQTVEKYTSDEPTDKILEINIVVGESLGIVPDCIAMYFDIIAKDTICEGAKLNFERIKPKLKCKKCGEYFERKPFSFLCLRENCGGEGEPTEIGREFFIKSVLTEKGEKIDK